MQSSADVAATAATSPPAQAAAVPRPDPTATQLALNFALVGGSCTCAQFTVHWTQTTMVRQQLNAMRAADAPRLGFMTQTARIFQEEGVRGLYRGFSAAALREMTYSSLRFGLYEPIKIAVGADQKSSPGMNVLAGLLAGTVAAAIASPTDMLTIRMMAATGNKYATLGGTAVAIAKEGGLLAFYRGIDTTVVRAAILGGTKMGAYDTTKQQLRGIGWNDGPLLWLTASVITGFLVTCTTSPATNARTMIMASPKGTYSGMVGCMLAIVQQQGPMGLFRGFVAQWARFGPYALVQFTVWEKLRVLCGLRPI